MKKGFSYIVVVIFIFVVGVYSSLLFSNTIDFLNNTQQRILNTKALNLAQSGISLAIHNLSYDGNYSGISNYQLNGVDGVIDITITKTSDTTRRIASQSFIPSKALLKSSKKIQVNVEGSSNAPGNTFSFAIQAGGGGFYGAENKNPDIDGSIYSNENVHILGTGSKVSHDIYAVGNIIMNGQIGGNKYSNQESRSLPVVDINYWQQKASEGRVHNGDYVVAINGSLRLGGANNVSVINGRLLIPTNATIYLDGPIWVKGTSGSSIEISGNPKFIIPTSYNENKSAIIADQKIAISGNASFKSDTANTWLLLLSSYPGTLSPSTSAIEINSNAKFDDTIVYAYNGQLWFRSNTSGVKGKAFVGQKILIDSSLKLNYDSGLAIISYSTDEDQPSGGFDIVSGSYAEINI